MIMKYRGKSEMKDSGVEWLGMIPVGWEVKKLKHLLEINPLKSEVVDMNINCNFVPMNKIHNSIVQTDEIKKVKYVYSGYTYFKNNDIVMAKVTPCYENGDIAIAKDLVNSSAFSTTEINVFRAKNVKTTFIFYVLQESHLVNYGSSHMTGVAGLKRVPTDYFSEFKIALPCNLEQNIIEEFLERKDKAMITLRNKIKIQIQKLKQAKQSLISEAVTGKIDLREWEIT